MQSYPPNPLHQVPIPSMMSNNNNNNMMYGNSTGVVGLNIVGRPSPLIEPPPIETLKYSTEKGGLKGEEALLKQFANIKLVDIEKSPSARLINNNIFSSSNIIPEHQQQPFSNAVYGSSMINIGMMNPITSYPQTTTTANIQQQPPLEKPPLFLYDKAHFEDLSCATTLTKTTSGVYTSLFVNTPLGDVQNKTSVYKWNVKINTIKSWLAVGVAQTRIGDDHKFTFSPYDEHGAYMLSANGYVWNRQLESANKYEYVAASNFSAGDVLSLELNCGKRELVIYRNNGKIATINDIRLPVYPSFMMHGMESVEYMGLSQVQQQVQQIKQVPVEFAYHSYHMTIDGKKITKKTKDVYHTVFFKNLIGDTSNFGLFKWRIKIISTTSWIGLGVVAKEIAQGRFHNLSPYENHGGYIYSLNGYGWSAFYEGANKYTNCGSSCSAGDTITLELNCASKELTLTKDGKNLITFKQVHLPVYPFIMMHGIESVELLDFLQEDIPNCHPDTYKFDGVLDFKHNPETIETVGCKIKKFTDTGYSNVYVNRELGPEQIIKRYKIKINKLASWTGIGVIKKENALTSNFNSYSPYDNNGAFIISANGYTWDNNLKDPKYKLFDTAKFAEGDVIILELNCITKELNFYKNIITNKMATIQNISLPVYPFLMLYGKEEVEFLEYLENTIIDTSSLIHKQPSFKYLPSCISVNGHVVTKTVTNSYTNVFVNTPLGKLNQDSSVFKWQVKILSLSWMGIGVTRREVAAKSTLNISPYDEHGSYFLSQNGYVWNRQLADPYYTKVEGATYQKGDVLVFTLDCKQQSLQISKNGVVLTRIDQIRLPVYPSFVFHDAESIDFSWL